MSSVAHEDAMRHPTLLRRVVGLGRGAAAARAESYDVVVYGATSAGAIAAVQDVPYAKLRARLLQDSQVLSYSEPPGAKQKAGK